MRHPFVVLVSAVGTGLLWTPRPLAAATTVTVSGRANVFAAGRSTAFEGVLPPAVGFPAGPGKVITFTSVTGTTIASATWTSVGPDGSPWPTDISSYRGIAGIRHPSKAMFLVGLFLTDSEPVDPAPQTLDFSSGDNFASLSPAVGQTFFVGDGLTGTGSGSRQQFQVPPAATRLFLGFADGNNFSGAPGNYSDNGGALTVTVEVSEGAAESNLLVNGSFEQPGSNGWSGLGKGSTYITGWVVTRDTVDYVTLAVPCSHGNFCLDLDGTPGFGAIAQTFATTPGATYTVAFNLSGNPDGPPTVKQLRVSAANQQADFSFDTTGRSRSSMGWTTKTWSFTASSTQTTLEFASLDTTGGSTGPLLDNVLATAGAPSSACTYAISPTSAQVAAVGGTGNVAVTAASGCSWTAASSVSWITVTAGASGTGNGPVSYSVAANTGTSSRTGTLTVAGQTFSITQGGASANLLVNGGFEQPAVERLGLTQGSTYIPGWVVTRDTVDYQTSWFTCPEGRFCLDLDGNPGAGAISQTFTTTPGASYAVSFVWAGNMDCAPAVKRMRVRAAGQQSDFTFDTTGRSRSNMGWTTGTWTFTAAAATTALELQSLDLAATTCGPLLDDVRVVTSAGVPACSFSITPTSASMPASGGSGTVGVIAAAGCMWTASSNAAWITITSGASGTGNGTVSYSVAVNTGAASRTGTPTIAGQTFAVTQAGAGAACTFAVAPATATAPAGGGTGTVSVTAASGCSWTATSSVAWITITAGASGTGNGTVSYSTTANTGASSRTGTLTIAGQTFVLTQAAGPPAATAPLISDGGVVNGADFTSEFAPGMLFSIFGANLSSGIMAASNVPLPRSLDGVSVEVIDGSRTTLAPLIFISPGQINAQLPFGLVSAGVGVRVRTARGISNTADIRLSARCPRLLTTTRDGRGQAILVHADNTLVSLSAPATPSETVVLYLTGLGAVDPAISEGAPGGDGGAGGPVNRVTEEVKVLINGVAVKVHFAGLAPGFPGLYQVNFTLPDTLRGGMATLTVKVGKSESQWGIAVACARASWEPIGGVQAGPAGARLEGYGFALTVPPGAFAEPRELRLLRASAQGPAPRSGVFETFGITGLPSVIPRPMTIEFTVPAPLPAGQIFLMIEEPGENGGTLFLPANVEGSRASVTLPPRRGAPPPSGSAQSATKKPANRAASADGAQEILVCHFVANVGTTPWIGSVFVMWDNASVPEGSDIARSLGAWVHGLVIGLQQSNLLSKDESIWVYIGRYQGQRREIWGEGGRSSWSPNQNAIILDADQLAGYRMESWFLAATHLLFHIAAEQWAPDRAYSPRWIWFLEASAMLYADRAVKPAQMGLDAYWGFLERGLDPGDVPADSARRHGYGAYFFLKFLMSRKLVTNTGVGLAELDIASSIHELLASNARSPTEALGKYYDLTSEWLQFCGTLPRSAAESPAPRGELRFSDSTPKTRLDSWDSPDLSAHFFRVSVDDSLLSKTGEFHVEVRGNDDIKLYVYAIGNSLWKVLAGPVKKAVVTDVAPVLKSGSPESALIVVVVNASRFPVQGWRSPVSLELNLAGSSLLEEFRNKDTNIRAFVGGRMVCSKQDLGQCPQFVESFSKRDYFYGVPLRWTGQSVTGSLDQGTGRDTNEFHISFSGVFSEDGKTLARFTVNSYERYGPNERTLRFTLTGIEYERRYGEFGEWIHRFTVTGTETAFHVSGLAYELAESSDRKTTVNAGASTLNYVFFEVAVPK